MSPDTRTRIDAIFEDTAIAEAMLDRVSYLFDPGSNELRDRIHVAALKVSKGCLEGLERATSLAETDWRDLLVVAGFETDTEAHKSWWPSGATN